MEAYVAGRQGARRPDRARQPPPHPAGQERRGLGQPAPALLQGLHRGLLLRPAHRQGAAAPAHQGADRPDRLPRRRDARACCRQGDLDGARRWRREYRDLFEPGSFFLEVQSNGMSDQLDVNAKLAQLSADESIPLVATADAHYVDRKDARAHDVLMCIASGKTLDDERRIKHDTDGLFIAGGDEMEASLPQFKEAIANTQRIAELCNVELPLGKSFLPALPAPRRRHRGRVHRQAVAQRARPALRRDLLALRPRPRPLPAAARAGAGRHLAHGLQRLLPHRPGLHQLGQAARRPGGAGARLRRRLDRGLGAAHHRHRPHPLGAALRALPQPRSRLHARLRHRLLPGPARGGHRPTSAASTAATTSARSSPSARSRPAR